MTGYRVTAQDLRPYLCREELLRYKCQPTVPNPALAKALTIARLSCSINPGIASIRDGQGYLCKGSGVISPFVEFGARHVRIVEATTRSKQILTHSMPRSHCQVLKEHRVPCREDQRVLWRANSGGSSKNYRYFLTEVLNEVHTAVGQDSWLVFEVFLARYTSMGIAGSLVTPRCEEIQNSARGLYALKSQASPRRDWMLYPLLASRLQAIASDCHYSIPCHLEVNSDIDSLQSSVGADPVAGINDKGCRTSSY